MGRGASYILLDAGRLWNVDELTEWVRSGLRDFAISIETSHAAREDALVPESNQ